MAADLFEKQGLALKNTVSTNDEMTKLDFVRQGLGVALLLADECREDALNENLSIWETDPIRAELFFAFLSARQHDPVLHVLRKAVQTVWNLYDS